MDGTRNLMVARGDKSVWDKPTLASSLYNCDQERWLMAAWGSALVMVGARRGGMAGGVVAALGTTLAVRAAMGRHDLHVARRLVDRALSDHGWRAKDIVADASEESFPASDSPSWTAVSGATPER
jgi:uncharacterized membrane protein